MCARATGSVRIVSFAPQLFLAAHRTPLRTLRQLPHGFTLLHQISLAGCRKNTTCKVPRCDCCSRVFHALARYHRPRWAEMVARFRLPPCAALERNKYRLDGAVGGGMESHSRGTGFTAASNASGLSHDPGETQKQGLVSTVVKTPEDDRPCLKVAVLAPR
ncbi:hypothetical protein CCHOA_09160 [Corynebacterium choanae]|uniref:Uncharacterized protein n=1 Tax=Corynebacterium choanae TaxID=1862358 RepID=A0A3G6J7Y3_9CORY|nr:hypothetical protein CCHOA_09160 [Corynebacterium choanae]